MADVKICAMGDLHPSELTGLGLVSARAGENTLRFLGEHSLQAQGGATSTYLGERLPTCHDPAVNTVSLRFEQPFTWVAFSAAMETMISLRGKDLLRVKGIVNVDGQPTVVQGAGNVFYPPLALDKWPSDDRDFRLVFITRNMHAGTIYALFEAVGALRQHA